VSIGLRISLPVLDLFLTELHFCCRCTPNTAWLGKKIIQIMHRIRQMDNVIHGMHVNPVGCSAIERLITDHPPVRLKAPRPGYKHPRTADRIHYRSFLSFTTSTGGYTVIKNFETASINFNGESISRRRVRLVSNLPAWAAIAILAFVGCLNFASTDRARAQESMSCKDKCRHEQKVCLYNGSSEELCDYDYKQCVKACDEQK
jgi:hypothetical protein